MTYASRTLGFDDSEPAKFRLHCIELYEQLGWEGVHVAFPELKRSSFFRWRKAYVASGKKLTSLVPTSTRPRRTRTSLTPPAVVEELKRLRQEHPRLGKMKVKPLLDEFCRMHGYTPVSATTIGRLIARRHLFYAGKVRRRSHGGASRLNHCPRSRDLAPGYIQVDGVRIYDLGRYRYFLTGVDVVTKQAWVSQVPSFTSTHAASFIRSILRTGRAPVHTIQTDNGSEFAGVFEATLKELQLTHLKSRPRSPQTNGYIERFNWTLKDEFLYSHEEYLDDTETLKAKLADWLSFYHTKRVHQALDYQTPHQYVTRKGATVS